MLAQPGKKLLFMGAEIGQWSEWSHDRSLDWHLLDNPMHAGLQQWVADVNRFYRDEAVMHSQDFSWEGFEWLDVNDAEQSIISLMRKAAGSDDLVIVACNFTPVPRYNYRIGAPRGGVWIEKLNSDANAYCGGGIGNLGKVQAEQVECFGRPFSLSLTLPALSISFFKSEGSALGFLPKAERS
jgi:1,4-alpha-glucan branching enzyme